MKILFFVAHLKSGGTERTVSYLSKQFACLGNEVIIASLSNEIFYDIADNVSLIKFGISDVNSSFWDRIKKTARRVFRINKLIISEKPDAVICMLPYIAKYIFPARCLCDFALITSERNNPDYVPSIRMRIQKKIVFKIADGIIFQTERARNCFSRKLQSKSVVIHNAVGVPEIYDYKPVSVREKKIVCVGRLITQKNYPQIIRVFSKIHEKHPDYILEIFGEGPEKGSLIQLVDELGITDSVCFKGVKNNVMLHAASSACYVLCSSYEGMPNSLLEALGVGLPCVSTDCPFGPSEIIVNGVNGLLVPCKDDLALENAIETMLFDFAVAEKCSQNARNVLDTHSMNAIALQYMSFIKKTVKEKG